MKFAYVMPVSAIAILLLVSAHQGLAHEGHDHSESAPVSAPASISSLVAKANFTALNATDAAARFPELLYFLAATQAARLSEFLSAPTANYTVIAPSNKAFADAVQLLGGVNSFLNSSQLGGILAYHVLQTEGKPLADGLIVPSLYYNLPVKVQVKDGKLTFLGGGTTAANALYQIQTKQGDVYVVDSVLDRRILPQPGSPGSVAPNQASVTLANQTLANLPQAIAQSSQLRAATAPAPAAVTAVTG